VGVKKRKKRNLVRRRRKRGKRNASKPGLSTFLFQHEI